MDDAEIFLEVFWFLTSPRTNAEAVVIILFCRFQTAFYIIFGPAVMKHNSSLKIDGFFHRNKGSKGLLFSNGPFAVIFFLLSEFLVQINPFESPFLLRAQVVP